MTLRPLSQDLLLGLQKLRGCPENEVAWRLNRKLHLSGKGKFLKRRYIVTSTISNLPSFQKYCTLSFRSSSLENKADCFVFIIHEDERLRECMTLAINAVSPRVIVKLSRYKNIRCVLNLNLTLFVWCCSLKHDSLKICNHLSNHWCQIK